MPPCRRTAVWVVLGTARAAASHASSTTLSLQLTLPPLPPCPPAALPPLPPCQAVLRRHAAPAAPHGARGQAAARGGGHLCAGPAGLSGHHHWWGGGTEWDCTPGGWVGAGAARHSMGGGCRPTQAADCFPLRAMHALASSLPQCLGRPAPTPLPPPRPPRRLLPQGRERRRAQALLHRRGAADRPLGAHAGAGVWVCVPAGGMLVRPPCCCASLPVGSAAGTRVWVSQGMRSGGAGGPPRVPLHPGRQPAAHASCSPPEHKPHTLFTLCRSLGRPLGCPRWAAGRANQRAGQHHLHARHAGAAPPGG